MGVHGGPRRGPPCARAPIDTSGPAVTAAAGVEQQQLKTSIAPQGQDRSLSGGSRRTRDAHTHTHPHPQRTEERKTHPLGRARQAQARQAELDAERAEAEAARAAEEDEDVG